MTIVAVDHPCVGKVFIWKGEDGKIEKISTVDPGGKQRIAEENVDFFAYLKDVDIEGKGHLQWNQMTAFQRKVLLFTAKIPKGKALSYAEVAAGIGHPKAYRAVGSALKANPFPLLIPCHRVVKSNRQPGRFSLKRFEKNGKAMLLQWEGVRLE